ncbi:MAG: polysaccharide pyruvyl transferase family protein [bacterium]
MKKLKIFTFNRAHNYGAFLQVFALQQKLIEKGYSVKIVDLKLDTIIDSYRPLTLKNGIKKNIRGILKLIIYFKPIISRYKNFNKIIEKKLNLTDKVKNVDDIINVIDDEDILLTGSDQVWNLEIVKDYFDLFTLNQFENNKKISYAASLGSVNFVEENREKYILNVSKINNISVREVSAQKKLNELIDNKIEVVLDPTLLISMMEWDKYLTNTKTLKEKYICAYVISPNDEYIKIVNELSEKTGLKVLHFGLKNPGYKNILKSAYEEGPLDFVNYIKNAEYVVATSFHATIFSIIYNKKFFIIPHVKTGSRVNDLLNTLDLNDRIFNEVSDFKNYDINSEIDWKNVNVKLNEEIKKSDKWLTSVIDESENK